MMVFFVVIGSQTFDQVVKIINERYFPLLMYLQIWGKPSFWFSSDSGRYESIFISAQVVV